MKICTVTLRRDGIFEMPDPNSPNREGEINERILDEMEAAEFSIVAVQPHGEEATEFTASQLSTYEIGCLLELTLPLPQHAFNNNPAIYKYCVEALSSGYLTLQKAGEPDGLSHVTTLITYKVEDKDTNLVFEDAAVTGRLIEKPDFLG